MKNFQYSKHPDLRYAYVKKLEFSDGTRTKTYSAGDLQRLLRISKQHAYRLIAEPERITEAQKELLLYKDLQQLTSWGPGWYLEEKGLRAPNGYVITAENMEYNASVHKLYRWQKEELSTLRNENKQLKMQIKWLTSKLSRQPEVRRPEYDKLPLIINKKFGEG
ncbi:MAG: hypothetical protein OIF57_11965 [Marinobacterium sp.]|nr:hypothetical protein [Marinobacterium sp.]